MLSLKKVVCKDRANRNGMQQCAEAVAQRCSVKKVFLEISQNSLENTCARVSFLIKLHRCFPANFAKFLRTPFLTEHLRWLLLSVM